MHMKTSFAIAIAIAALMPFASAFAAESFRIESEAQLARDYGDQIEQVASGVYQIVAGPLAGKTISIGEFGLAYDLAGLRAHTPTTLRERKQLKARIASLELDTRRYAQLRVRETANAAVKRSASGTFPCYYTAPSSGTSVYYSGAATVTATTELYLRRNDGFFNPYYARAIATASGTVYSPAGVPSNISLLAYGYVHERQLGQPVSRESFGTNQANVTTGYVYSGATAYHDLFASASVSGRGYCYGYVSITDRMTPGF